MMSSVFIFLSLFLYMHDVDAFHIDKPKISINFFDEFVSESESLLNNGSLNPNSTPSNSNVGKDLKKEAILTDDPFQSHDQNKTSQFSPEQMLAQVLEFDETAEEAAITDVTPIFPEELDYSTIVSTSPDLQDPDLLEPEITRIFFMKAIANLIEHIMETLFSVSEPPKSCSDPHNYDYDLMPSRSLKKRNLPSAEGTTKTSDVDRSIEHTIGTETSTFKDTSTSPKSKTANNHTEFVSFNDTHVLFVQSNTDAETKNKVESTTGHSSHTSSATRVSNHVSSHHGSHRTTDVKPHISTEESEAKSITTVKSHHEIDSHPDGKVEHEAKLITQRNVQKVAISAPEDKKMFDFRDESSMLNDEVIQNKDTHYLKGEDHDEHLTDEDHVHNHDESSSLLTVLLVTTTFMILLILVAFGIAAAYFFQKYKTQSSNQNGSNLHTAVA